MTNIITTEIPICVNNGCTSPCMIRKDGKWSIVCSRKCLGQYNSIKSRQKSKQTCIERYGVENPMSNSQIHNKFKKTMIDKYGVENALDGVMELLGERDRRMIVEDDIALDILTRKDQDLKSPHEFLQLVWVF